MTAPEIIQIVAYFGLLLLLSIPLGNFIGKILGGEKHLFSKPLGWCERLTYKISGINPSNEMNWKSYAVALGIFNLLGFSFLLILQLIQNHLPLNPNSLPNVPFWLAFNTAVSFATNTNWQAYSGEATMSYMTQMIGLGVQNFLSAATGIAVVAALAKGISRKSATEIGSFWVDMIRSTIYLLLPISVIFGVILISQGVVQNFSNYLTYATLEGANQTLPFGPAASQIAIKQLGTNGGGFFGVNSAHPFENPTPLSNFLQMFAILIIPVAMPIAFGRLVKNMKHGYSLFGVMFSLLILMIVAGIWSESLSNPITNTGFWEGKDLRFGIGNSLLWGVVTTAASNGSVNSMLSSFSPLAGGIAMLNIMLGEVIFGGVGSGLYGMVLFGILTVFIAGLMVGRTPEFLGKKIEAPEIKLAVVGVLAPSIMILLFSAIASISDFGLSSPASKGPHGLSEMLYTFASAAGNNGSAFAGLNANTNFYNILTAVAMIVGRYAVIFPVLAIAGNLAAKKQTPPSTGTFPTEGRLFSILLAATVLIVGALTFFPALCLGPIMEHFLMINGRTF